MPAISESGFSLNAYSETAPEKEKIKIHGLTHVPKRHKNWCGYASASTLLQYWWGEEQTDIKLFESLHGKYDPFKEDFNPSLYPTPYGLIKIAKEILAPQPKVHHSYGDYYERKGIDPHDLLKKLLRASIPVIIRVPRHYKVAVGFDENYDTYNFIDSAYPGERIISKKLFDEGWQKPEPGRDWNGRYMMLAIFPADKNLVLQKHKENNEKNNAVSL
jgi:hypothetical protein